MGFSNVVKFLTHRIFEFLVVAFIIVFLPQLPPNATFSKSYHLAPTRSLEGALALNSKLNDVEIWHKGALKGPETFADYKGELYTSIYGRVVKLEGDEIIPVATFGKPCRGDYDEKICGRPLGMRFDKNGILVVADAYYGIFKVNVNTGDKEQLVRVGDEIEGVKVTLPNSVAIASNGEIFWTDSSTEFSLEDGIFDLLADGSGRLLRYDPKTKINSVLIWGLHFANGVALSRDESFIVVAETARNRLHRYYLNGPKEGTSEIFIDGLPGMTDNLKSDGKGNFWVPLVVPVDDKHPSVTQILGPLPLIRRFLARVLGIVEWLFKFVDSVYPNEFSKMGVHVVGHFSLTDILKQERATILLVSEEGEIVDSLHCTNQKLTDICEAHIFGDNLYLGSPFRDYIGRIPLSKIDWKYK